MTEDRPNELQTAQILKKHGPWYRCDCCAAINRQRADHPLPVFQTKIIIYVGTAMVLFLVMGATVLLLFVKSEGFRHQIETVLADVSGLEVTVGAPVGLAVLPSPRTILHDVQMRNGELEVASAGKAAGRNQTLFAAARGRFHRQYRAR